MPGTLQRKINLFEEYFAKEIGHNPENCLEFIDRFFLETEEDSKDQICLGEYFLGKFPDIKEAFYAQGDLDGVLSASVMEYAKATSGLLTKEQESISKKKPSRWLFEKAMQLQKQHQPELALEVYKAQYEFDEKFLYETCGDLESSACFSCVLNEIIGELEFAVTYQKQQASGQEMVARAAAENSTTNLLKPNSP